ncbi:TonB-dependent receptor plug domain-containing protein [Flagellimonas flava]|uniref:TonB-dependent Receptor Plug Domain n=1 Tax=Flagellimonas flava TaxID=570519 RepID=A0A1M5J1Q5_9FLAO|nr:TonB-dependent receptor plug domain-containing protein [Allomuricauda flava]SHG34441.1 TonB-dependent Receptor Plug Domain [Allomuricauda flava]
MKISKFILIFFFGLIGAFVFGQEKQVTICWDVSYSMYNRDLDKEFYFLDAYFKTNMDASVALLSFNNEVVSKESFGVKGGDWSNIKERLRGLTYDGATSFELLDAYTEKGDVLVFTDGNQNLGTTTPNFGGEVYIINGKKDFNRASLNLLTIVNNGNLINLTEKTGEFGSSGKTKAYSGTVYSGTSGLAAVDVYIKEFQSQGIKTNTSGGYSIRASVGDTLVVSFGNKKKQILLEEEDELDFVFDDSGIQLQEVVVVEDRDKPTEEITTGFGKENKDKIGYAVQSIDEEDISPIATTGNTAIQGKFSGVSLGQNEDLSQIKMRPSNSVLGNNYGLIVIDGVPMERSNSFTGEVANTDFVNPQNIAEVTVLKGLAATNRFGSLGANGVLLITTKTAKSNGPTGKKRDLAQLTDNFYDGKLKVNNKTLVTPYLKELKKGKNLEEAYKIYLNQRKSYWDNPEYLVDVASFFYGSKPELGNRILSNILEKDNVGFEELRGMYLKSMETGNHKMALVASTKMLDEYPNKIQPYLDVAMAHKGAGNYQEAYDMLASIVDRKANTELNFLGLDKIAGAEIRNLVNRNGKDLDMNKVEPKYRNNLTYNARLLLDWSNPDAEFVVQFVNPQKRFFNWEHTDTSDKKRILNELQHGYASEQFEIVGSDTVGDWILNVTYLGNRTHGNKVPTFLKCTVQYNFGKPNQRNEEFMIRLMESGEEQQLAKFAVQ